MPRGKKEGKEDERLPLFVSATQEGQEKIRKEAAKESEEEEEGR